MLIGKNPKAWWYVYVCGKTVTLALSSDIEVHFYF